MSNPPLKVLCTDLFRQFCTYHFQMFYCFVLICSIIQCSSCFDTLTFTLCEYSANDTTRLTTSTQKTPITTTLSTSKTTKTKVQSKATTPNGMPVQTTTEGIDETTTQMYPSGKDPRFGDNNITDTPEGGKPTTTSMDDLITVINTITDGSTSEDATSATEQTTIPSTKRPSRFETTLELDFNSSYPTTTEQVTTRPTKSRSTLKTEDNVTSTEPMDLTTTTESSTTTTQQPGDETTTNQVLTVTEVTIDYNETSTSVSQTVSKTVGKTCKTRKDCVTNEICFKKQCLRVCDTNGNVTKLSDDCIKGTCANNYFVMIIHICHKQQYIHIETSSTTTFYSLNSTIDHSIYYSLCFALAS